MRVTLLEKIAERKKCSEKLFGRSDMSPYVPYTKNIFCLGLELNLKIMIFRKCFSLHKTLLF